MPHEEELLINNNIHSNNIEANTINNGRIANVYRFNKNINER